MRSTSFRSTAPFNMFAKLIVILIAIVLLCDRAGLL
jgi:hypothetical protein